MNATYPTATAHHAAHRDAQDWWVPIFRGSWMVIVGALAFAAAPMSTALLFAAALAVTGAALITDALWMRRQGMLYMVQGVLSLAAAAVIAFTRPEAWAWSAQVASAWAIAVGAIDALVAQRHRAMRGRLTLFVAAGIAVVAGVLGFAAVRLDQLARTPGMFAAFALAHGVLLLGYGLRRRRRSGDVSATAAARADEEHRVAHA